MKDSYLGITIGPIYKTMQQARKLRELWSVSFTFSMLMKHLVDVFSEYGQVLSPHREVKQLLHGAGIFPDRCFIQLKEKLDADQLQAARQKAFTLFSNETGIDVGSAYYQVYLVQTELSENPIQELNTLLDGLELQQQYHQTDILNLDKKYWNNPDTSLSAKFFQRLYKLGYADEDPVLPVLQINDKDKTRRFPSIPEISTHELAKKDIEKYWGTLGCQCIRTMDGKLYFEAPENKILEDDDQILLAIQKAFPDDFLFRHKYFSIVQADGDNVGKLISAIESKQGEIADFSKALNNFAERAAELLVSYGAFPVYLGGDDLLFFAPIANNGINDGLWYQSADPAHENIFGNNLFFLLSKLNDVFKTCLQPVTSQFTELPPISLSFGVMVGYYKHPMSEIQNEAHDLLVHDAKMQPSKNYISMKVQKHSGQSFSFGFVQEGPLYESFLRLSQAANDTDAGFLNSVMYKLEDQKVVINQIADKKDRLTNFFKEFYNENIHKRYKSFFMAIESMIIETFRFYPLESLDAKMSRLYAALRFIHFINAKDVTE